MITASESEPTVLCVNERRVIYEIIQGVNTTRNLDELLRLIHTAIGRVLYAENCFIALYERETGFFHKRFYVDQYDAAAPPQQLSKSCTAYVFRNERPLLAGLDSLRALVESGEIEMIGTPPAAWLGHYVARFRTVELNASFYRWPRTATFASWRRRLPPGFQLSVKAPRGLTHAKRLYAPEVWVERMAACWHELGERRAVLLVQLHPAHERDDARLDFFLSTLPDWMRVAVEFRHPSWHDEGVYALLERHGAATEAVRPSAAGAP